MLKFNKTYADYRSIKSMDLSTDEFNTIENITGDFISNYADSGGAILTFDPIKNITGNL